MKTAGRLVSGIAFAFVAAACGDDAVEPEDVLTEEEAVALFKSMNTVQFDTTIVPIHFSEDSLVIACPGGGQAKLVGEFAADTTLLPDTLRWVSDFVITPRGCKLTGDGIEFTVDGDPSIHDKRDVRIPVADLLPNATGSVRGGVKWELEDRSGSCEVDMTLATEVDGSDPDKPVFKHLYKGVLCGNDAEVEVGAPIDVGQG